MHCACNELHYALLFRRNCTTPVIYPHVADGAFQLTGADLTDANLAGANLARAALAAARLGGAVLDGAVLEGADLTAASLVKVESQL